MPTTPAEPPADAAGATDVSATPGMSGLQVSTDPLATPVPAPDDVAEEAEPVISMPTMPVAESPEVSMGATPEATSGLAAAPAEPATPDAPVAPATPEASSDDSDNAAGPAGTADGSDTNAQAV
jgi:hypothetical protein